MGAIELKSIILVFGIIAGCFLRGLGCVFDAGIPFVLAFLWLLS